MGDIVNLFKGHKPRHNALYDIAINISKNNDDKVVLVAVSHDDHVVYGYSHQDKKTTKVLSELKMITSTISHQLKKYDWEDEIPF